MVGTPPEAEFDRITELASQLFDVPIVLISLVDANRQWLKSHHGTELCELPRNTAFCMHTLLGSGPLVVTDTWLDPRFAETPMVVGSPNARFYAGTPLITRDGTRLGSLCVLDTKPREFGFDQTAVLVQLAAIALASLEARLTEQRMRREIAVHEQTARTLRLVQKKHQRITEHTPGMVYQFVRRAKGEVEFLFVSDACRDIFGLEPEILLRNAGEYFRLVHPDDEPARKAATAEAVATLQPLFWEGRHIMPTGETRWIQISAQPERAANGDLFWDGVALDITARRLSEDRLRMLESSVEHANDAILVTEAEPIDEPGPRILYANQAFTRTTGYSVAEVLGKNPRMFQGPKTDPEAKAKIRRALKRWKPIRIEVLN